MKIDTTRFGKIDIANKSVLHLQGGMFGFEKHQQYALIEDESGSQIKWLQSIDDPALAFVVVNPLDFFPEYEVELSDDDVASLGLENPSDAAVIATVTIDGKNSRVTTNLLGPIVINSCTLVAKQVVIQNEKYGTKHLIAREICQDLQLQSASAA